jgi:hypothetical protein
MCLVRALVEAAWYCVIGLDGCKIIVEIRAMEAVRDEVSEHSPIGQS